MTEDEYGGVQHSRRHETDYGEGGWTRAGRVVSDKLQTEGKVKRINLNWPFMMIKQSNSLVHSQLYAIESKDA